MSTVLFNPTNEELKAQHQGVDVILAPYPENGHIVKVDDARARHILNILAPRGLTTLEYGDDRDDGKNKKAKAASGRERNKAFKRKQVIDFNQLNQLNKQQGSGYLFPAKHLKSYSDELGIKLIEPYSAPDEGAEKISTLMEEGQKKDTLIKEQGKEVSELRTQVSTLSDQVSQLLKTFQQPLKSSAVVGTRDTEKDAWVEPVEGPGKIDDKEMLRFKTLNKASFNAWLKKNWDDIPNYPDDIRNEIDVRHIKHLGTPLPDSLPE